MPKDPAPPLPIDGRKANAEATQTALKQAGRALFGQLGFEGTSLGALCAQAGVTTGALYHHFGDKKGLFAAVAEELDASLVQWVQGAMAQAARTGATPWDAFLAGMDAFLAAAQDPQARRIGLTDAPAVLGAQGWLEIRERQGLGAMVHTVQHLQTLGCLQSGDSRLRARLILGLLYGTVDALDHDTRPAAQALADARQLLHTLLGGLRQNA